MRSIGVCDVVSLDEGYQWCFPLVEVLHLTGAGYIMSALDNMSLKEIENVLDQNAMQYSCLFPELRQGIGRTIQEIDAYRNRR